MKDTFVNQHGGDHYQAEYQHWDWATDIGMLYLIGTATKYLSRWKKKGGVDDLIKSKTYLEKAIKSWNVLYLDTIQPPDSCQGKTEQFIASNQLGEKEAEICRLLSDLYVDEEALNCKEALRLLEQLIADAGKPC